MNRDDIQKLLGGYATGTLTPEEQQTLFEAALEDQELFDALAREEALREVLSDPASRAHLLAAMEEAPAPWYRRWSGFWPKATPVAALAAILLMVGITLRQETRAPEPPAVAQVVLPRVTIPLPKAELKPPVLPPPPELRRAAPASAAPYPLPGTAPVAPPPPPARAAAPPAQIPSTTGVLPAPMTQQAQQPNQFVSGFSPASGDALLSRNEVLQGVVTDATGTGVKSATVELKSGATGQVTTASTNGQGEFRVGATPGTNYQISASAPGFRTATASANTPVAGQPQPVNLRLDVGSVAETVGVIGGSVTSESRVTAPLRDATVSLHGVVTDPSGSAVSSATVAVKSLATGVETRTSTDEKGEFKTPEAPGSSYQITASKQGFQTITQVGTASAEPVNLQMQIGSTADSVTVMASAPRMAGGRGGAGGGGGKGLASKAAAPPAMEYQIFERRPAGNLVKVAANGTVPAGAALILRVTPAADGYLRIDQGESRQVLRGVTLEETLPPFARGRVELHLYFDLQPSQPKDQAPAATLTFNIR